MISPDFNQPGSFPRSPRETLGGHVIAARTLDKCRASIAGTLGDYKFDCPLDGFFFEFAGLSADAFREFVSSGADDEAVAAWIGEQGTSHGQEAIIRWNNEMRSKRICELPIDLQIFLEGYVPEFIPPDRPVYVWFDVYDLEEGRI